MILLPSMLVSIVTETSTGKHTCNVSQDLKHLNAICQARSFKTGQPKHARADDLRAIGKIWCSCRFCASSLQGQQCNQGTTRDNDICLLNLPFCSSHAPWSPRNSSPVAGDPLVMLMQTRGNRVSCNAACEGLLRCKLELEACLLKQVHSRRFRSVRPGSGCPCATAAGPAVHLVCGYCLGWL